MKQACGIPLHHRRPLGDPRSREQHRVHSIALRPRSGGIIALLAVATRMRRCPNGASPNADCSAPRTGRASCRRVTSGRWLWSAMEVNDRDEMERRQAEAKAEGSVQLTRPR